MHDSTTRFGLWKLVLLPLCFAASVRGEVLITSPTAGEPAFGQVKVEAQVFGLEGVEKIDFLLDGASIGTVDGPPFKLSYNVGQENKDRRFEAVAYDGQRQELGRGVLVTPAIRVDMEVDAALQQLYVTVSGGNGRRVLDLEQDEFAVIDNGAAQEIVTFARGDVRLTAVILVDASASMQGVRLHRAVRGAQTFLAGLKATDDASVLLFSDRLLYWSPFSNGTRTWSNELASVQADGGTALNDHLYLAMKRLDQEQGRRVVILLSDGIDSHSALRMREVRWLARRSQALLYWIRLGGRQDPEARRSSAWKNPQSYRQEYERLERTIDETGGRIVDLADLEQASGAFREILSELREQYVLGYYPTIDKNDGSFHRVTVRVRSFGNKVRTRDGYVDY